MAKDVKHDVAKKRVAAALEVLKRNRVASTRRTLERLVGALDAASTALRVYDTSLAAKHVDGRDGLAPLTAQLRAALKG